MTTTTPQTILAVGEVLWDLLPDGRVLGGAPLNFAARIAALGGGGDHALIVSRLGQDDLGREAHARLRQLAIDDSFLQFDPQKPTGTVQVSFSPAGQPDYLIVPDVAYDFIEATPPLLAAAARAHCICFGTLAQRAPASRSAITAILAAAPNATCMLDLNLRRNCHTPEIIDASLRAADILKLNDDEVAALVPMLHLPGADLVTRTRALLDRYALDCCVVTLGPRGALALDNSQTLYTPGLAVTVLDTVGSGDAFLAAFVHAYLRQEPLSECCRQGNALGAIVATQRGATAPITQPQFTQFLSSPHNQITDQSLLQCSTAPP